MCRSDRLSVLPYDRYQATRIGLYGFGAAAHLLTQLAVHQHKQVFAFTKTGDTVIQAFARELGVTWAGDSHAIATGATRCGNPVCPGWGADTQSTGRYRQGAGDLRGIHMSDIPAFPYRLLWEERRICSVANLTRRDGDDLFRLRRKCRSLPP